MRATFPRNEDEDGDRYNKKREPDWVVDLSSRLTEKYIHKRCLQLLDAGRYEDMKAIQHEFVIEDN